MNIETKELLHEIDKLFEKRFEEKFEQKFEQKFEEKFEKIIEPRFNKIEKQISDMQKEVAKIPEIQKEIQSIGRSVAVIEHEHGEKLDALFDAFTMNSQKIEQQEKRISIYERKIEQHDDDIFYLKNKIQGL